jgi:hypothetical protein
VTIITKATDHNVRKQISDALTALEVQVATIIASGFTWSTESSNFTAVASHGYIITSNSITATLPSSTTRGDEIRFIVRAGVSGFTISGPPAGTTNTLNPSDKHSSITLSNANQTASFSTSSWSGVRASLPITGPVYWEVLVNVGTVANDATGVADASAALTAYLGVDAHGWGHLSDGYKSHSGFSAYGVTWATNAVMMHALDASGNLWIGKDNVWMGSGNPATGANPTWTGISGTVYPALFAQDITSVMTMRFGAGQSYSPPAGFTTVDNSYLVPINGVAAPYVPGGGPCAVDLVFDDVTNGWWLG